MYPERPIDLFARADTVAVVRDLDREPFAGPARPPRDSIDRTPTLVRQTLRLSSRTSIGGDHVRIRISNEYGDRPLVIGAAHIAVRDTGAAIVAATDRALTFGGRASVSRCGRARSR